MYIKNKVSKFYFFHLLYLILAIPLSYFFFLHETKGKVSLILDVLLVQSWVPDSAVWRSYNGLAWFLSTLVFCYMLKPVAQRLFSRLNSKKCVLLIMLSILVSIVMSSCIHTNVEYWLYAFPPIRLLDFYSGYILGVLYKKGNQNNKLLDKGICTFWECFLSVVVIGAMLLYPYLNEGIRRQAVCMPIAVGLVYIFSLNRGYILDFLSTAWIVKMGDFSFYYYISHQVISKYIYKVYQRTPVFYNRTLLIDMVLVVMCLLVTVLSRKIVYCIKSARVRPCV